MKVGDHCYISKGTSTDTILFYQKLKNKGLPLICPCHLKNTDELIITDQLTKNVFLLKLVRNNQLTVAHQNDLFIKKHLA